VHSLLAKGGTSKKRPSHHLHKVTTQNNKESPQTFQMALISCEKETRYFKKETITTPPHSSNSE
jgi:hypothetical protein